MKVLFKLILSLSILGLVACGGGSSGGGGGTRTFSASGTVTATPQKASAVSIQINFTIEISGNNVTLTFPQGGVTATGTLSADGKTFTAALYSRTSPGEHPLLDGVCDRPILFTGVIAGSTINGTVSGTTTCTVTISTSSSSTVVTYNGQYSASEI